MRNHNTTGTYADEERTSDMKPSSGESLMKGCATNIRKLQPSSIHPSNL